jgi:PhnB protein
MHGEMEVCGTNIWFADEATDICMGENIKLSATVPTGKDAEVIFEALCDGGSITQPPSETFYSVFHASITDKFGVNWNVMAKEQPKQHGAKI